MNTIGIKELQTNPAKLSKTLLNDEYMLITRRGEPLGVALPFDDNLMQNGLKRWMSLRAFKDGDISLGQLAKTLDMNKNQALELLGQKFNISMLTDSDLGYTRLNENKVFVNILPIMEGRQNGQKVVEGLILHELGHHIYHKGRANQKIWKKAQRKGLHGLLNIVSDEHLERNLRTKDSKYDSRLKQLASFAFQHTKKDFGVQSLLQLLNVRALEVLSQIKLGVLSLIHI